MFRLTWRISIGNYRLATVDSVAISRSVDNLSDTAIITLPATVFNRDLRIEDKIKSGDRVTIDLGYNDQNKTEFKGYLNRIKTDGGNLTLECEDDLYLYRVEMANEELKNTSLRSLLEKCNQTAGKGISLACDYNFRYEKFVIANTTAYDILAKLQKETNANVYLKGDTLHVHPPYSEVSGEVSYDFGRNIDKEGTELTYLKAEDRRLLVTVSGKSADGKTIKVTEGSSGGDSVTLTAPGVIDRSSLQSKAKAFLDNRVYTGYEGHFTGWLVPFCDAGYSVLLVDPAHEHKNGTYYVVGVEVEFSKDGGKRKINIGKKLK